MSKNDGLFSLIFVFGHSNIMNVRQAVKSRFMWECPPLVNVRHRNLSVLRRIHMNRIYELQKKIETARHELDEALLQENRFEYYYEKSTRLDKLIEEYLESQEGVRV